jgi:hypothetical protein
MNSELPRLKTITTQGWLSVCLLLAIFFLPLHIHVPTAAASHLSNECSCLRGSRTQAGLAVVVSSSAQSLDFAFQLSFHQQFPSQVEPSRKAIRAPPVFITGPSL